MISYGKSKKNDKTYAKDISEDQLWPPQPGDISSHYLLAVTLILRTGSLRDLDSGAQAQVCSLEPRQVYALGVQDLRDAIMKGWVNVEIPRQTQTAPRWLKLDVLAGNSNRPDNATIPARWDHGAPDQNDNDNGVTSTRSLPPCNLLLTRWHAHHTSTPRR